MYDTCVQDLLLLWWQGVMRFLHFQRHLLLEYAKRGATDFRRALLLRSRGLPLAALASWASDEKSEETEGAYR